jgi:UDP:flavonoid glycosyltransferase YjiC (YdhE family)
VAPYTGLGVRLRTAGHQVAVATHDTFADLVTGAGLEFRPVGGDLRAAQTDSSARLLRRCGPGPRGLWEFARVGRVFVDGLGDGIAAAAEPGIDVLLLSASTAALGYSVAELHGVPSMGVFLQPLRPTAAFPPMVSGGRSLGRWGNRWAGRLGLVLGRAVYAEASRRLRARLGLPPVRLAALDRRSAAGRWPVLHGFSPTVVPRPADWPPELEVAGYWWPERGRGWSAPPALARFLADGPPPVFVGFGSMVSEGDRLTDLVGAALRRAGVRGVVQAGWAGLSAGRTDRDVITIGEAPHEWLFPRMAALVHHAGSGTTAAGLRAGVPAVPVPMLADQPFWAARLVELGVSPGVLTPRRLSPGRLAEAIRAATRDPGTAARARSVAARLAGEDGAGVVVQAVDRLAG